MNIGEKIQFYRKKFQMSQEELGQRLLVSRQTVSLWEKNQTVPSIDNLIRLKEIFGVSLDNLLDCENDAVGGDTPREKEYYRFTFSEKELKQISKKTKTGYNIRFIIATVCYLFLSFCALGSDSPYFLLGLFLGFYVVSCILNLRVRKMNKAADKKSRPRVLQSVYEYSIYDDCFIINIFNNNEKTKTLKFSFSDVDKVTNLKDFLILTIQNQAYIIKKKELTQDTCIFSKLNVKTPAEKIKKTSYSVVSLILFIATILSIFMAMLSMAILSSANHLTTENMWVFFLFTPISAGSVVFGFFLKAKGYRYLKNIIAGFIMTTFLCLYGCFFFIFPHRDTSDKPILAAEKRLQIDIPKHEQVITDDYTKGTQNSSDGYVYYRSTVYFDSADTEKFEKEIKDDEKWVSKVPSNILGITPPLSDVKYYDYVLIYNIDEGKYNSLPEKSGEYTFLSILYKTDDDEMIITKYKIDFIK